MRSDPSLQTNISKQACLMLQNLSCNDYLLEPPTLLEMTVHTAMVGVNPAIRFWHKGNQLGGFWMYRHLLKIPFLASPVRARFQSSMHTHLVPTVTTQLLSGVIHEFSFPGFEVTTFCEDATTCLIT